MALIILLTCFVAMPARAATMVIINGDGPGEGFNDPAPFTPVGGNNASTLGQARLNAFQHAADIWGALIDSPVPIEILASMDPLGGSANGATLGQADSTTGVDSFVGAPFPGTLYPVALANALAGTDLIPAGNPVGAPSEDIDAQFNSELDGNFVLGTIHWYYGFDGNPPVNPQTGQQDEDFVTTVLHELGHGLGFGAEVNINATTVSKIGGLNGAFMRNVEHHGANPPLFPDMTDAQRFTAVTSVNALHFIGAKAVTARGAHVELYAPPIVEPGSTLSHFDENTLPNELMSPFTSGPNHSVGLALQVLQDMGWKLALSPGPTVTGPNQISLNTPANFSMAAVSGASAYEWEVSARTTTIAPEGGESGASPWTVSTSPGYNVIDTQTAASGTASLHLAMPVAADQTMTLNRSFRPGNASQLQFKTWLNCVGAGQFARFQISPDDGRSWTDAWTQQGTDTVCTSRAPAFSQQTVSLAAFAGKRIRIRLLFQNDPGSFFNNIDAFAGWHVDDITMTNAEEFINPVVTSVNTNAFSLMPGVSGNMTLRARARVAGQFTLWGPDKDVVVLSAVASVVTHSYVPGLNLVPMTVSVAGIVNASDLDAAIVAANSGVTVSQIFGWDAVNQRFGTPYVNLGSNLTSGDFALQADQAYFVQVAGGNASLTLQGIQYANISLPGGLNLVAAPVSLQSSLIHASDLAASILTKTGASVSQIFTWDAANQRFGTPFVDLGTFGKTGDFTLAIGTQGYFVQLPQSSSSVIYSP